MAENTIAGPAPATTEPEPTRQTPTYQPRFDIVETDGELTLFGDLPGVQQGDLDIRYENEQLVVLATVRPRNEGLEVLRQEYGIGDFRRVFRIGESIDAEAINAEVHNGVLTIHLPKTEAAKPRRIEVKAV
ncbi:MAG: Hsp20/alpha crystallin family protein [Planctomycetales bacterium]|nr:Hsp20/alpha crystallin family protein [Planctomycetales bacterium]